MGNLQDTLSSLQPYVIGIRYISSAPVLDVVFKDDWIIPESKVIKKIKGDDSSINYYMIYSEQEGIGLDELLDYVRVIINVNFEREQKHALLKEKVEELKNLFKKSTLSNLKKLKFVLTNEDVISQSDEIELHEIDPIVEPSIERQIPQPETTNSMAHIGITDEEYEMNLEEQRAERNRQIVKQKRDQQIIKKHQKVELPPRQQDNPVYVDTECSCGAEEACSKCIDSKGL